MTTGSTVFDCCLRSCLLFLDQFLLLCSLCSLPFSKDGDATVVVFIIVIASRRQDRFEYLAPQGLNHLYLQLTPGA